MKSFMKFICSFVFIIIAVTWYQALPSKKGCTPVLLKTTHSKNYPPEVIEEIIRLAIPLLEKEKLTIPEVAERFGIVSNTFRSWIMAFEKKNGPLDRKISRQRSYSDQERKEIVQEAVALNVEGIMSIPDIAKKFGMSTSTLYKLAEEEGVELVRRKVDEGFSYTPQTRKDQAVQAVLSGEMTLDEAVEEFMITKDQLNLWINVHRYQK